MGQWWEILIHQGTISPDQWDEAQRLAKESNMDEGDALAQLGYATGDDVMRAKAQQHGMEYVDLTEIVIPPAVVELVPESVARENYILPMAEAGESLKVIISDPLDFDVLEKLRFILDRKVEIALAPKEKIIEAINRHYGQAEGESADSMLQEFTDTAIDFTETEGDDLDSEDEGVDESSAPVVRLVQLIINEAVQLRASDIHIEPFEDRVRIRYRIDGRLVERHGALFRWGWRVHQGDSRAEPTPRGGCSTAFPSCRRCVHSRPKMSRLSGDGRRPQQHRSSSMRLDQGAS